ncbi:hypothetical protein G6F43_011561 [Rhizopus delemar]|nr:hypothetical protein G6F43_011561 [Rhizopus delemar]
MVGLEDVNPAAAEVAFEAMLLGIDVHKREMKCEQAPAILALLFPYVYTFGRGFYSCCARPEGLPANPDVMKE